MECSVCLQTVETGCPDGYTTSCGHVFHGVCIHKWFRTSHRTKCPYCRKTQTFEDIRVAPLIRGNKVDASKCAICLDPLAATATSIYTTTCDHRFHPKCVQRWYQRTKSTNCPYCQKTHTVCQIERAYVRAGVLPWTTMCVFE
jgi:hypothetical protein